MNSSGVDADEAKNQNVRTFTDSVTDLNWSLNDLVVPSLDGLDERLMSNADANDVINSTCRKWKIKGNDVKKALVAILTYAIINGSSGKNTSGKVKIDGKYYSLEPFFASLSVHEGATFRRFCSTNAVLARAILIENADLAKKAAYKVGISNNHATWAADFMLNHPDMNTNHEAYPSLIRAKWDKLSMHDEDSELSEGNTRQSTKAKTPALYSASSGNRY